MKLYYDNKALLTFQVPLSWKKVLMAAAKKEKTTINGIVSKLLDKKFWYAKIDDEDTRENN